ncbi:hypothetical protein TWF696_009864 [Orbilia brochopaga]|uniref:Uncharacterized protein n=1 Tax=Orbilia brochopaga TaxID=3140254 RepID=A0AAV9UCJ3_9PEZI
MSIIEYGTVGQVEYRSQRGEWSFLKRRPSPQDIISLGEPTVLLKPCLQDDTAGLGKRPAGRQSLARRFAGNHTEFVPAVSQIIDIYEESTVVEDLSQWAVSKTSPLMTVAHAGHVDNLLGGTHPLRKVLVYVTGISGNKLAATAVQLQRLTSDDVVVRRPSLKPQSRAIFACDGPIEQLQPVYEAETKKTKPWLLLRTQKTIYLVHIAIDFALSPGDAAFSVTCMAAIESPLAGGHNFLHVTINPWQGDQIAVVDTNGTWSIWTFVAKRSHRSKLAPTDPKLVCTGCIYTSDHSNALSWANITWGCSENELLIATRTELFRLDIEAGSRSDIFTSLLESSTRGVEIVNLSRSQNEAGQVILLTNYALHLLQLDGMIKPVLVWRHYRHPEDRSLCCSISNLDNGSWVLLYSRYNPNISVLRILENNQAFDLSLLSIKGLDNPVIGLALLEGSVKRAADERRRADVFTIVGIGSGYEIWRQDCTVDPNLDINIFRRTSKRRRALWIGHIVPTSEEEGDMSDSGDTFGDMGLGSTFEKLSLGTQEQAAPGVSILNLEKLYEEAFEDEGPAYKSGDSAGGQSFTSFYLSRLRSLFKGEYEGTDFGIITCQHVKRELEGLFDDPNLLFTEIQRLSSEDANSAVGIIDLDAAFLQNDVSSALPALSKRDGQENEHNQPIVGSIYDTLISIWLESLPTESPAKTRLRRERLARMLSIDIGLSSLGACYNMKQARSTDLTNANGCIEADKEQLILTPLQIPLLATVEKSPDDRSKESHGIIETGHRDHTQGRRSSLSQRLFLEAFTLVTHTGNDPDIDALLNDWDVGRAPGQYQWRQLSSIQRQAYEESQRSRSRSRSRTGSRQRRATSTATAAREPDAMPNGDLHMTQPVTRTEIATAFPLASSQIASSQRFPSSQVQRGHHGDSRKMKKRRTEGF